MSLFTQEEKRRVNDYEPTLGNRPPGISLLSLIEDRLSSTEVGYGADAIGVPDANSRFTATTLSGVLDELMDAATSSSSDTFTDSGSFYAVDQVGPAFVALGVALGGTNSTTRNFTENNYVADNDSFFTAIDKLDVAMLDSRSGRVADQAAVKAIVAGDRWNGRIVSEESTGYAWVFDADSVAGASGTVLVPDAGAGRWIALNTVTGDAASLRAPIRVADNAAIQNIGAASRLNGTVVIEEATGRAWQFDDNSASGAGPSVLVPNAGSGRWHAVATVFEQQKASAGGLASLDGASILVQAVRSVQAAAPSAGQIAIEGGVFKHHDGSGVRSHESWKMISAVVTIGGGNTSQASADLTGGGLVDLTGKRVLVSLGQATEDANAKRYWGVGGAGGVVTVYCDTATAAPLALNVWVDGR